MSREIREGLSVAFMLQMMKKHLDAIEISFRRERCYKIDDSQRADISVYFAQDA